MSPDTKNQLHLLSVFHYVVAAFGALASLAPALYIAFGVAMLTGALDGKGSANPPPPFFGWMAIVMGALLMLAGAMCVVLVILAGRFLSTRRHWTFCVVVAALLCAFFPFGTVLGVFTILVLSKDEVRREFEAARAAATPAPPGP
jgi:hypothetical protein